MTNSNKQSVILDLSASLRRTAAWRREMQNKYINDPRNGRAAETLYQLTIEANDLSDDSWKQLESHYNWASSKWSDAVSQASREVEFRGVNTLPAFVDRLVSILSQSRVAA
jgi:hypothetical protein